MPGKTEHNTSIKEFVMIIDKKNWKIEKQMNPRKIKSPNFQQKALTWLRREVQMENPKPLSTPKKANYIKITNQIVQPQRETLQIEVHWRGTQKKKQKESAKDPTKTEEAEDPKESSLNIETMEPLQPHKIDRQPTVIRYGC